jgi:hypothetical protein
VGKGEGDEWNGDTCCERLMLRKEGREREQFVLIDGSPVKLIKKNLQKTLTFTQSITYKIHIQNPNTLLFHSSPIIITKNADSNFVTKKHNVGRQFNALVIATPFRTHLDYQLLSNKHRRTLNLPR